MRASISTPTAEKSAQSSGLFDARKWALGALLLAVSLNHYTFDVAGARIKIEHVVIAVLLATVLISALLNGRIRQLRAVPLLWIVPYIGVLAVSSLLTSPEQGTSMRHTAMLALLAASAYLVYLLTAKAERFHFAVKLMIGLGVLEAVTTLIMLALNWAGFSVGTQPGNGFIIVPYGTLWEPNILGSFLAASGVAMLALLVASKGTTTAWLAGGLGVLLVALGLSLARASWLAFIVGGVVVVLCYVRLRAIEGGENLINWRRILLTGGLAALGAVVFLGLIAPVLFPATFRGIWVRLDFRYYSTEQDPAVQARVSTSGAAIDGILSSPIIGHGAGSYGFDHEGEHGEPGWISNLELHILYDSGVLGLGVFLAGLAALIWRAWRGLTRHSGDIPDKVAIIGLLGAMAVLLVAFQATEGTWLGFSWIYIGLLARAGNLDEKEDSKRGLTE